MNEQQIGQRLIKARGVISQKDLARSMRDRGYKWSQATVWSVERGERPLRLSEAVELAAILATDVSVLAGTIGFDNAEAQRQAGYAQAMQDVRAFTERLAGS